MAHRMSIDRAYRLWRLAKLQIPRKRSRKRVAASRPRALPTTAANQVWAYVESRPVFAGQAQVGPWNERAT